MSFENKVIIVTGGTKGIGKACVDYFLERGARVASWGRAIPGEGTSVRRNDGNLLYQKVDVSDEAAIKEAVQEAIETFGGIHHLVQSAGIQGDYVSATEIDRNEWNRVMDINLTGAWLTAKHTIPSMLKSGGGCIVNMASVNSFHCQKKTVAYATSKAALLGLSRSIAG